MRRVMATLLLLGRRAGAFVAPRCRVVAARREMTLMPRDEQTISPLPYKGVLYDLRDSAAAYTSVSVDDFAVRLGALERAWRDEAQLSGWVALPLALARFAEAAASVGFELHHAEGDSMVLYKWFGAGEDKVPPYGNTQVGCAGFVVNEKNEILVVKEWQSANDGADRVPSPNWKLPGGLADRGESFFECAARETLEETGVACRAVSVLGMWHRHGVQPRVETKSSTRLQSARIRKVRHQLFGSASRTRRERSIRPKISRIDFDLAERENFKSLVGTSQTSG